MSSRLPRDPHAEPDPLPEPVAPRPADMDAADFLKHGRAVLERMAAFLERPEAYPVVPPVSPGDIARHLPAEAPAAGEPMEAILADFDRIVMPGTTHWNHPGFFAYFSSSGSAPGILAEMLAATLNVNAMLWRSGPSATELEDVTLGWLRRLIGLPDGFDGTITDSGSSSTLYALAAARELAGDLRIREEGLAGRPDLPRLTVYCSEEAHSSIDKAVTISSSHQKLGVELRWGPPDPSGLELRAAAYVLWEIHAAPIGRGQWWVTVAQRDQADRVLETWQVGTLFR